MDESGARSAVQELTGKDAVYFFDRCDAAINYLLGYFKNHGALRVLIPDSGGWFSYQKLPLKHGLEIIPIATTDSLIDPAQLSGIIRAKDIVLINAYGGYFVREPLEEIFALCKKAGAFFINDACACIGTPDAAIGDYIVCSTRYDKPLATGFGGFLATTEPIPELTHSPITISRMPNYYTALAAAIATLAEKREAYQKTRAKIMHDLSAYNILHPHAIGINVTIAYSTPDEKAAIHAYCAQNNLDTVDCPNYIKVMQNAVSIEVKRITFKNSAHYHIIVTESSD